MLQMSFAGSVMLKDAEVRFEVLILFFLHLLECYNFVFTACESPYHGLRLFFNLSLSFNMHLIK